MTIARQTFEGLPVLALRAPDGARAVVALHGGHVLSWRAAGSDQELLYLSPRSLFADGQPIRGGIPVVFPQFSERGPLLRHGFVRTRSWQLLGEQGGADGSQAQLVLGLCDDAGTRALWPHRFALALTVGIGGSALSVALTCTNTGATPWSFMAALHTYLAVPEVATVRLHGLAGTRFDDMVAGSAGVQDARPMQIEGEVDRVHAAVAGPLELQVPQPSGSRTLTVSQQGFEDVVVWNPAAARCALLNDMPADGYRHMLCIEAARILRPVTLAAAQSWTGQQRLVASG